MQIETLISFLIATALVTSIPGPNILLIVNDSIQYGFKNGLFAVFGVTIGMIPLFSLSLAGVSTLLVKWSWLFDMVKILGVIYLIYLGFAMIISAFKFHVPPASAESFHLKTPHHSQGPSKLHFFIRGVLICITNPKGLLFAGAFFPQFLDKASPLIPQVLILCSGCLIVATIIGSAYAFFAGTAGTLFQSKRFTKISSLLSGFILVLFGISLFFTDSQMLI